MHITQKKVILCAIGKIKVVMTTIALDNLWRYLQGLALTEKDRQWLVGKLQEPTHMNVEQLLPPYTREELYAMIDQSERDINDGRYRDIDEMFSEWDEENSTFSAAEPEAEYNSSQI